MLLYFQEVTNRAGVDNRVDKEVTTIVRVIITRVLMAVLLVEVRVVMTTAPTNKVMLHPANRVSMITTKATTNKDSGVAMINNLKVEVDMINNLKVDTNNLRVDTHHRGVLVDTNLKGVQADTHHKEVGFLYSLKNYVPS